MQPETLRGRMVVCGEGVAHYWHDWTRSQCYPRRDAGIRTPAARSEALKSVEGVYGDMKMERVRSQKSLMRGGL
jgi:hypothetical protein